MKKYSEILQLPIMEVLEGKEHDKPKDVIMNLDTKEIALVLEGSVWGNLNIIKSEDLEGIGDDFIMIMTSKAIHNSKENKEVLDLLSQCYSICGIMAVTTNGNVQGSICDFSVDVKSKKVIEIELENGTRYQADQIISISEKYLFLQEEAGEPKQNSTEETSEKPVPAENADDTTYLLGKVVTEDILDEDDMVVIEKGTVINSNQITMAKESGVLADLILNAE